MKSFETAGLRQVTTFTSERIVDFSWTRDGKTLLLAKGDLSSDSVLLANGASK